MTARMLAAEEAINYRDQQLKKIREENDKLKDEVQTIPVHIAQVSSFYVPLSEDFFPYFQYLVFEKFQCKALVFNSVSITGNLPITTMTMTGSLKLSGRAQVTGV